MLRLHVKMLLVGVLMMLVLGSAWSMDIRRMSVDDEAKLEEKKRNAGPKVEMFTFAKHFQDHMVLQGAPAKANVYGFAPESAIGQQVTISLLDTNILKQWSATVEKGLDDAGQWLVTLDAMPMGTAGTIKADLQGASLVLNDVIFGDVWLCSGQSNMEFTVIQMLEAQKEIEDAHNYPNIRMMTVYQKLWMTPLNDLLKILQDWTKPGNDSVGGPAWKYFSAVCWLFGKGIHKNQNIPVGLVATDWGGTRVEVWSSPDSLAQCGVKESSPPYISPSYKRYMNSMPAEDRHRLQGPDQNSVVYNAMIHPLLNMTIKGVIWYQGEADADGGVKMNRYNCTFPAMVKDWRKKFNMGSRGQTDPIFPFGFVQLAPENPGLNRTVGFPDIRWHQTADWGYVPNKDMPNVFMAVAMDLPDFNSTYGSIHPRDKTDVGNRFILSGLAVAYGVPETYQGPFPQKGVMAGKDLMITYGDQWVLEIRSTEGFELECASNISSRWVATTITGNGNTSIFLDGDVCKEGENIRAIRYEWVESPCEFKKCAIYEMVNNLPAPPFVEMAQAGDVMFTFDKPTRF